VQFEDKESTDKCLAAKNSLILNGNTLDITAFSQKSQRPELNSNNLYLKGLPKMPSEEASEKLK
jgi:hypothetical protein